MEIRLIFMAIVCLYIAQHAFAMEQDHSFSSLHAQGRYERLIKEIRCAVCQNQSLFDSNSTVAGDMRKQVYAMVNSGLSDHAIRQHFRSVYGDAILFMPPWRPSTLFLWCGPVFMLVIAAVIFKCFVAHGKKIVKSQYAC